MLVYSTRVRGKITLAMTGVFGTSWCYIQYHKTLDKRSNRGYTSIDYNLTAFSHIVKESCKWGDLLSSSLSDNERLCRKVDANFYLMGVSII